MNGIDGTTEKKRSRITKRARRLAKARGARWRSLGSLERRALKMEAASVLLDEAVATGKGPGTIEKRRQQLAKYFQALEAAGALGSAGAAVDPTLTKVLLPGQPDPGAAAAAVTEIKKALSAGRPGVGGFRP